MTLQVTGKESQSGYALQKSRKINKPLHDTTGFTEWIARW